MTLTLSIKVEYTSNDENYPSVKFVYAINTPAKTTIEKLITDLQQFIRNEFGYQKMQLVHLVTGDGYLLIKRHICAEVLQNNEKLLCVDMNQFVTENWNSFDTDEAWLTLKQHDASDDVEKYLYVGIDNSDKLYLSLFGGRNNRELYFFTIFELLSIIHGQQKENNRLQIRIPRIESSEWFIDVIWTPDSTSSNSLFLTGSLKTADSTNVISKKIQINLIESTKSIEKGEIISLSDPEKGDAFELDEKTQARLEQRKKEIPPPVRTGPTLNVTVPTNLSITKHECEGDSSIRMVQEKKSAVQVNQETFARNGTFLNFVTISDIIISKKPVVLPEILQQKRSAPAERSIAISQVLLQYQRHDGKWLDCEDSKFLLPSTQKGDRQTVSTTILNIEPDKLISVSIQGGISVKGVPNKDNVTRFRAHRSLPQPLKLKIIVTDSQSRTCSLTIEQLNRPLTFATEESFVKNTGEQMKKLIAFVYADDCEYDQRIITALYLNENHWLIIGDGGRSAIMQKSQIRTMQFNAKKSNKTEEIIEFITNSEKKAIALFDPETFLFYAVRIELTTTTSQTIETIPIPVDEIQ